LARFGFLTHYLYLVHTFSSPVTIIDVKIYFWGGGAGGFLSGFRPRSPETLP